MQCGRVEEFCDPVIEKRQAEIASERGFAIREHVLCLYVDCLRPDCDRRNPAPPADVAGAASTRRGP
jgi:Fur family ferric uptake transcriptional regulator